MGDEQIKEFKRSICQCAGRLKNYLREREKVIATLPARQAKHLEALDEIISDNLAGEA